VLYSTTSRSVARVVERPLRLCDRVCELAAASHATQSRLQTVRCASRCTSDRQRVGVAHEFRRKDFLGKSAAPERSRVRLALHAATTVSADTLPSRSGSSHTKSPTAGEPRSPKLLTALSTRATGRLVLVQFDLGVQAHLAVLVRRRCRVLRTERIINDRVSGELRVVLTLGANAASIQPT